MHLPSQQLENTQLAVDRTLGLKPRLLPSGLGSCTSLSLSSLSSGRKVAAKTADALRKLGKLTPALVRSLAASLLAPTWHAPALPAGVCKPADQYSVLLPYRCGTWCPCPLMRMGWPPA